ncbi:phosphotransferase family protein [Phenylobacterium sp.]|jgi:aminoglycoside phosphotransferase (APT) family kinase protein|uniref:phosphotransferase family protein n=1 Tax=Phenylobacterium sp. TaxID=1871053 RepID=UPI002E2EF685|nr:phosphotransferase [Phenylobacterium sp.]HEX2560772.1 phosphotransferase [Phenylobacterium sp.]
MSPRADPFETLARRLGGELVRAWPLTGGVSAATSALEVELADGARRKFVVRRPGGHYLRDLRERDVQLLERLADAGLPAPCPRLLDAEGEIFGQPALVLDYLEGELDFGEADLPAKLDALARQLAAIHAAPLPAFLPLLPRLDERAFAFFARTPEAPDESLGESEVRAALRRWPRPPSSNPDTLLHGDFWPGNVLWRDGQISGVIDWEDAAIGDPLYDLAISRLDLLWAYGPSAVEPFTVAYARLAPQVDLTFLPWFDLGACLRPCGQISIWATSADAPAEAASRMRERHASFRSKALAAYALLTR